MTICSNCNKDKTCHTIEATQWEMMTNDWGIVYYCEECLNNMIAKNEIVYYKDKYYWCEHPFVVRCDRCGHPVHINIYSSNSWYCNKCFLNSRPRQDVKYCPDCWCYHSEWLCTWCLNDISLKNKTGLSFSVRKDSKSRDPKGWEYNWNSDSDYVKSIWQYQTERDLDPETSKMLIDFYHNSKDFKHYYTREPIYIEWDVTYNNTKILTDIKYALEDLRLCRLRDIKQCKKISKYSNYYLKWLTDDWLVKRGFIDVMWNIRERAESINKFFDDIWIQKTNAQMTWQFRYVLSSDIRHKIKAFDLNKKVSSCQKSHNYDSFARWAYDAITNGCNCPILLYSKWSDEPFARITTRIMYDKEGQEYILIDRIYHSWEFSDSLLKWTVYKWIVQDLKQKWYKVIASNYSAHDESTYAYLASLWMKSNIVVKDLCQPLRRLIGWYGYYCDWWTMVRTGTIDDIKRATDYLDKAYVL